MAARRERRPEPQQARHGKANGNAKLREVDVSLIRALRAHGVKQTLLCAMFEVSPASVSHIVTGKQRRLG